jgi:hypothetical protein
MKIRSEETLSNINSKNIYTYMCIYTVKSHEWTIMQLKILLDYNNKYLYLMSSNFF